MDPWGWFAGGGGSQVVQDLDGDVHVDLVPIIKESSPLL